MPPGITDLYQQRIIPNVKAEILRETEEQIVGSDIEELKKYYYQKYAIDLIVEDPENEANYEVVDYLATIPAHRRDRFYAQEGDLRDCECQKVVVEIPLVPNPNIQILKGLRGRTMSMSYSDSDFIWSSNKIVCEFESRGYQLKLDEDTIARDVEDSLTRMRQTLQYKNETIKSENLNLLATIDQLLRGRLQKIQEDKGRRASLTAKISIPLKKRDVVGANPIQIKERPIVQRIKPNVSLPEELVLDEDKVKDIISFLDNHAKNFEQTLSAVKNLGEEDLRDLLLANLNSVFQGDATGETFSKKGKTDIYLKISKGNILIAECKIWGGKTLYGKTIDQLRGYLTWRHNYGIMITFVRTKGLTKVLKEAEELIQSHESYIQGFRKIESTHFVSNHKVDDEDKEVKIHHLFYHLI